MVKYGLYFNLRPVFHHCLDRLHENEAWCGSHFVIVAKRFGFALCSTLDLFFILYFDNIEYFSLVYRYLKANLGLIFCPKFEETRVFAIVEEVQSHVASIT